MSAPITLTMSGAEAAAIVEAASFGLDQTEDEALRIVLSRLAAAMCGVAKLGGFSRATTLKSVAEVWDELVMDGDFS